MTTKTNATGQYFHVVPFIMLYKVVLTFKSVNETLVCDHSNESYREELSCGTYCSLVSSVLLCEYSLKVTRLCVVGWLPFFNFK